MRNLAQTAARVAILFAVALLTFGFLTRGLWATRRGSQDQTNVTPAAAGTMTTTRATDAEVIAQVDEAFREVWREHGVETASPADWLTICRRVSLALVGSGLSLEEIRALEVHPESARVSIHLERLLEDPRFHDYWSERLSRAYVGADDGPFIIFRRRRFRTWLSQELAANRPYDQLMRKLVTAEGLSTDRPEVNFLTVTFSSGEEGQTNPVRLAARTSRAFLGLRLDCLECHDDFLGNVRLGDADAFRDGTQGDFHRLAAFFSSARMNGLQGIRERSTPYTYQLLDEDAAATIDPDVPFGAQWLPETGKSRERLAAWLTNPANKQSARATVSRVWALLFGRPIGDSVDDLPMDQEIHPAIAILAEAFVASGFDLRQLIGWVVHSAPFQAASVAEFEITPQHESVWAVFPLVRLRPEQVAGSVIQAARIKTVDRGSSLLVQLQKLGSTTDFLRRYGDIGEDEFDQQPITVTQRLIMLNGKLVDEFSDPNPILNASSHIGLFATDDVDAVETAYLATLNRLPTETESQAFVDRLAESGNRQRAMEDIYWVLLNSSELAWNH